MSGRSDRRAIMAGLAGCVAAGTVGAVAGSGNAKAAAERGAASIDDRRILELAAEFERLERQRLGLFDGPHSIVDDDARNEAIEPLDAQQAALVDQIATLRASSVDALGAVGAALKLWDGDQFPDPSDSGECVNHRLAAWIALNAAAMAGRTA